MKRVRCTLYLYYVQGSCGILALTLQAMLWLSISSLDPTPRPSLRMGVKSGRFKMALESANPKNIICAYHVGDHEIQLLAKNSPHCSTQSLVNRGSGKLHSGSLWIRGPIHRTGSLQSRSPQLGSVQTGLGYQL